MYNRGGKFILMLGFSLGSGVPSGLLLDEDSQALLDEDGNNLIEE